MLIVFRWWILINVFEYIYIENGLTFSKNFFSCFSVTFLPQPQPHSNKAIVQIRIDYVNPFYSIEIWYTHSVTVCINCAIWRNNIMENPSFSHLCNQSTYTYMCIEVLLCRLQLQPSRKPEHFDSRMFMTVFILLFEIHLLSTIKWTYHTFTVNERRLRVKHTYIF